MQKLIQITDPHLFADTQEKLLGMETQASLDAVLKRMHEQVNGFDFYLCTGDLSQDGSTAAYQRLKDQLGQNGKAQYWIPGNHDNRQNMLKVVSAQQEMLPVVKKGKWQIIQLDSQIPGSVGGNFAQSQLDLLKDALDADQTSHTLIAMHHQPRPMASKWLDNHLIKNSDVFLNLIKQYKNVRVVLWGHVHQDTNEVIDGVHYVSTPSTCIQFTPKSDKFDVDTQGPGYRWMELHDDGTIKTAVSRVNDIDFKVDYNSGGY
ncbi:MAG: 3',5'-cyclic-AMP phosphodiesterase [Bermanella sp.]